MSESGTLIPQNQKSATPAGAEVDQAPVSDQERFDAVVDRDSKVVLGILAGVAILAALIMSTVALVLSSNNGSKTVETRTVTSALAASGANTPAAAVPVISLSVEGGSKRGPDGKMHDAFSKTDFQVKAGQPVKLRIDNKDDAPHSITSAEAGVSVIALPGTHTYTMVVKTAGHYKWLCILPCDSDAAGWAMTHAGYMAGYITAT